MINALKIDWGWYEVYCIYQLSCILPTIRPSLRGTPLFPQQFFYPSGSVIVISLADPPRSSRNHFSAATSST